MYRTVRLSAEIVENAVSLFGRRRAHGRAHVLVNAQEFPFSQSGLSLTRTDI